MDSAATEWMRNNRDKLRGSAPLNEVSVGNFQLIVTFLALLTQEVSVWGLSFFSENLAFLATLYNGWSSFGGVFHGWRDIRTSFPYCENTVVCDFLRSSFRLMLILSPWHGTWIGVILVTPASYIVCFVGGVMGMHTAEDIGFCVDLALGDEGQCVICLQEFTIGDSLVTFPCKHRLHDSCGRKTFAKLPRKCPTCRHAVDERRT